MIVIIRATREGQARGNFPINSIISEPIFQRASILYFDLIHKQAVTLETKRQGKTLGDRRGGRGGSEASVCARGRRACRMPSCVRARAAPSRALLPPRATPSLTLPSRGGVARVRRAQMLHQHARLAWLGTNNTHRGDPTTKRRQLVRLGRLNTARARPSTVSLVERVGAQGHGCGWMASWSRQSTIPSRDFRRT